MKKKTAARVHCFRRIAINKRLNGCLFLIILVPICSVCIFSITQPSRMPKKKSASSLRKSFPRQVKALSRWQKRWRASALTSPTTTRCRIRFCNMNTLSEFERYQREMEMTSICTKKLMQHASVTDVLALTEDQEPFRCYGDMSFRFRPSSSLCSRSMKKWRGGKLPASTTLSTVRLKTGFSRKPNLTGETVLSCAGKSSGRKRGRNRNPADPCG